MVPCCGLPGKSAVSEPQVLSLASVNNKITGLVMYAGADKSFGRHFFYFIHYLWKKHPEAFLRPYFIYVDDDTWVNIPLLLRFMQPYNPDLKVMFTGRSTRGAHSSYIAGESPSGLLWLLDLSNMSGDGQDGPS